MTKRASFPWLFWFSHFQLPLLPLCVFFKKNNNNHSNRQIKFQFREIKTVTTIRPWWILDLGYLLFSGKRQKTKSIPLDFPIMFLKHFHCCLLEHFYKAYREKKWRGCLITLKYVQTDSAKMLLKCVDCLLLY